MVVVAFHLLTVHDRVTPAFAPGWEDVDGAGLSIYVGDLGEDIAGRVGHVQDRSERENALVLSTGARWVAFDVEVDGADAADGEALAADADGRVEGGVGGEPFAVFGYAEGREEGWLVVSDGIGVRNDNLEREERGPRSTGGDNDIPHVGHGRPYPVWTEHRYGGVRTGAEIRRAFIFLGASIPHLLLPLIPGLLWLLLR